MAVSINVRIESIRAEIPALKNSVYLNTGTFGPTPRAVTREIVNAHEIIGECGGFAPNVRQTIEREGFERTRASVARLFNVTPDEIALTRSASDSICTIAFGLNWKSGDEMVITDQEHPSGELVWFNLRKRFGVQIRVAPVVNDPNETLQRIADEITPRTRLVFASHVCSTTGERLPARDICALAHDKRTLVAIDGAHSPGQFRVDLQEINPDFYVSCGHKWLLGPQGTGILFVARQHLDSIQPSWIGWGAQKEYSENLDALAFELQDSARRFEFGTKPWALFMGLNRAITFIEEIGLDAIEARVAKLAAHFKKEITRIPGLVLLTPRDGSRSAGLVSVIVKDYAGPDLREVFWNRWKILVSSHAPKHRVRFSVAFFNTEDEIESALEALRSLTGVFEK